MAYVDDSEQRDVKPANAETKYVSLDSSTFRINTLGNLQYILSDEDLELPTRVGPKG